MPDRLRVLVADDELLARRRLLRLLGAMPDIEIAGECDSGEAVLARMSSGDIDVLLLDIQMPGLTGIEALQLLPDATPVIFCTAHPDHALAAFDAGAVDYVLKPVEAPRLRRALDRVRPRTTRPELDRLPVPTAKGIVLLDPSQITHVVLDGELVTIFSTQGELLSDLGLTELHDRLPRDTFERVHRRALVNLAAVVRLEPTDSGGYLARMRSGHAVEVSRQAARALRRRLGLR
jgi:two-component system LytT family response regulator